VFTQDESKEMDIIPFKIVEQVQLYPGEAVLPDQFNLAKHEYEIKQSVHRG